MTRAAATAEAIVTAIGEGTVSCTTIVERAFDAITARDDEINAFVSLCIDRALERARQLDVLPQTVKRHLPLLGVPIALKDNICTKGHATTCGSKMLEHFNPPYDAAVTEQLERAGAIVIGKTNMDEFAMGSSSGTSYFGKVHNPHDVTRIPGGSSGGSAAAVSAGFVPLALGSDTGGSIRQPCSHCGVVGIKPTYGRVSRYGLVSFASSLDQIGPIAGSIRDAARLLAVISAADERDSTCAGKPFIVEDEMLDGIIKGVRVGVPREYFSEGLSSYVGASIEEVKALLRDRGASLIDISLPGMHYATAAYYIICTAEASSNLARYDGIRYGFRAAANSLEEMYEVTRRQGFGDEVKRRIMLGTFVLSTGYYHAFYNKATRVRTFIRNDFRRAFGECDVILSPVAPTSAFLIGENSDDPLQMYLTDMYTVSANLAGIPGISIPCNITAGSLPVGVQFMAPHWREDLLVRVASAIEMGR